MYVCPTDHCTGAWADKLSDTLEIMIYELGMWWRLVGGTKSNVPERGCTCFAASLEKESEYGMKEGGLEGGNALVHSSDVLLNFT